MTIIQRVLRIPGEVFGRKHGKFTQVPRTVVWLSVWMAINVMVQLVADLGLEIMVLFDWIPKPAFRMEFLFLTTISALLGLFTWKGLRRKEIDVTWNSLILSLFIESFLVISDLVYLYTDPNMTEAIIWIRLPFVTITTGNIMIITYMLWKMHYLTGNFPPFKEENIN